MMFYTSMVVWVEEVVLHKVLQYLLCHCTLNYQANLNLVTHWSVVPRISSLFLLVVWEHQLVFP